MKKAPEKELRALTDVMRNAILKITKKILDVFRTSTKPEEWVDTFKSFAISQKLLKA